MAEQEFYTNSYAGTTPTDGVAIESGEAAMPSTYPSKPVTLINIPEPSDVEAKFTYEYFISDEKENQSRNQISAVINDITRDELDFLSSQDRLPRFVTISFSPTNFDTLSDPNAIAPTRWHEEIKVSMHTHNLMFEEAMSNATFSSVKLMDTGIDKSFYSALSSSAVFSGFKGDMAEQMSNSVSSMNGSVRSVLKNPQAFGITFSDSDVGEEIAFDPLVSVRKLQFNFNVNNLIFGNLIDGSITDAVNVYGDELQGILEVAQQSQTFTAGDTTTTTVSETDFEPLVAPISQQAVDPNQANSLQETNEGSALIGFFIEKFEIEADGNLRRMTGIPVDSPDITSVIDPVVRYGGAYLYTVHAVSLSQVEAIRTDSSGGTADQVIMAKVLIASAGESATVICSESVPPPPPTDIRFKYDFNNDNLIIFWEFPINSQRDIKRFQIFRRSSISQPFTILHEYNFDNSTIVTPPLERVPPTIVTTMLYPKKFFTDTQFTKDSTFIYALSSGDAHGLSSNYSMQLKVSFNRFTNKLIVELLSRSGAPKPYPNIYMSGDAFIDTMKDSGHSRIKLYFDPEFTDVTQETAQGNTNILFQLPPGGSSTGEFPAYKLQIINTDLQESDIIDVHLSDSRAPPTEVQGSSAEVRTLGTMAE